MAYIKKKSSTIAVVEPISLAAVEESSHVPTQQISTAAAASEAPVNAWLIVFAYIFIGICTFLGYMIAARWIKPTPLKLVSVEGLTLFAIFYIFAAAVERLVNPLKNLIFEPFKKRAQNKRDHGLAAGNLQQAADGQAEVNHYRSNSSVVTWAFATAFSILGTSATGLFFLHAIGIEGVSLWLDILITGLAIGAGTKPLHDLIGYIENKNFTSASKETVSD